MDSKKRIDLAIKAVKPCTKALMKISFEAYLLKQGEKDEVKISNQNKILNIY